MTAQCMRFIYGRLPMPSMLVQRASCASYNRLNNSHACQNSKALNRILKTELGFQGWVLSDWGAQPSGVGSALAGLDVTMPNFNGKWAARGELLAQAVRNESVSESTSRHGYQNRGWMV
jgi:beta-glucosidase